MNMVKVLLLVVEDDMDIAQMYAKKLISAGFSVDIAHDGLEGYEKMKLEKPDLVLMDILMPNLNGLQALEKAKKDPEVKDIPIIMLTNLSGDADVDKALKAGAADYIVKSDFVPSEVVEKVKKVLSTKSSANTINGSKNKP